jgi:hypothetical protein
LDSHMYSEARLFFWLTFRGPEPPRVGRRLSVSALWPCLVPVCWRDNKWDSTYYRVPCHTGCAGWYRDPKNVWNMMNCCNWRIIDNVFIDKLKVIPVLTTKCPFYHCVCVW